MKDAAPEYISGNTRKPRRTHGSNQIQPRRTDKGIWYADSSWIVKGLNT